jgi:hypothetical protein
MDKSALWSRILGVVALILIVLSLLAGPGTSYLMLLGNILAAACAILSRRSSRKLVLWGAGVYAVTIIPWLAMVLISESRGMWPVVPPIFISITFIVRILSLIAIVVGTIGILLQGKRPASPPMSSGTGEDLTGATPADAGSLHSAAEIKRIGRKKGLVWGAVLVAVPLLVIGIFLLTRGGEKTDGPQKLYAEGQYFTVGSTGEEVLIIQGPPTFKLEMVWFYGDSQVQFDSDGKVTNIW